jgi:hypothetical protein
MTTAEILQYARIMKLDGGEGSGVKGHTTEHGPFGPGPTDVLKVSEAARSLAKLHLSQVAKGLALGRINHAIPDTKTANQVLNSFRSGLKNPYWSYDPNLTQTL